ncbi:MAG: asparagine synthase (glutamine-hydrolyzing) [Cyanobacteria bacterium REEB67]|nr:asparagine synthase (glutamine-hydrolyzing) [Cyanobacteria bacterium REEB67]
MCGIFTIYQTSPTGGAVRKRDVQRALTALAHRGPDGEGMWIDPDATVALGHTRLAIVGVDIGAQPIANEDGTIHLIVNGEFYGYEKIRSDLEGRGHTFVTRTDGEIALHLYEEYGLGCLKHLRGEFALVIYDQNKKRLFAARDRFGIKPLCYAQAGGTLYLASEAKAIFAAGLTARWDADSFFQSAASQYVLPDRTLFEGVKQLQPGHYLLASGADITVEQYWDLDYDVEEHAPGAAQNTISDGELIEEFGRLLEESVRLRLQADVPVCTHLSGGLDSSAIVALAMKHTSRPIKSFSISFSEAGYDEHVIARAMAAHCGADFEPISVSQEELVRCLPDAVYHAEGFAVNGHLTAKYILNRHIRKAGYKVALTGEGADEVVAGYPHLRSDLYRSDGREQLLAGLHARNTASRGIMLQEGKSLPLDSVARRLDYVPSFLEAKGTLGHKTCSVLADDYLSDYASIDSYDRLLNCFDIAGQLTGRNRVHQSLYLWSKTALVNYILRTLGDGTEMANSVEGRLPFLDHHLFEFTRNLPLSLKIKGTVEKYILRQAVKPLITKTIYEREKHPFVAPPLSRFNDKASTTALNDTLRSENFKSIPFFDQKKMINLIDSLPDLPPEQRAAYDPVLMMAMSSAALHKSFHL